MSRKNVKAKKVEAKVAKPTPREVEEILEEQKSPNKKRLTVSEAKKLGVLPLWERLQGDLTREDLKTMKRSQPEFVVEEVVEEEEEEDTI